MVNLETECESLLNAEYYSSKLWAYLGQVSKEKLQVKVSEIWEYDVAKMKYTKQPNTKSLKSSNTKASDECTCTNYMTEV